MVLIFPFLIVKICISCCWELLTLCTGELFVLKAKLPFTYGVGHFHQMEVSYWSSVWWLFWLMNVICSLTLLLKFWRWRWRYWCASTFHGWIHYWWDSSYFSKAYVAENTLFAAYRVLDFWYIYVLCSSKVIRQAIDWTLIEAYIFHQWIFLF